MENNSLMEALESNANLLYDVINDLLPSPEKAMSYQSRLFEAMRYSSLSLGKRLRPFLLASSASLFGVGQTSYLHAAAAIEFIHTYSLIHDDLPSLDDDDTRRGKPSCHVKFDEATAILAGDSLLTYAFEILSNPLIHADPSVRCELIQAVSKAIGFRGMVGGQMMDILSETSKLTIDEVAHMQRMKTGALFTVACEIGAILGKAPMHQRNSLKAYAQAIGLAFQITDDLLDVEIVEVVAHKTSRKNKSAGKATFVTALGIEKARNQAVMLSEQAIMHLESFDKRADNLRKLAKFIVERKS